MRHGKAQAALAALLASLLAAPAAAPAAALSSGVPLPEDGENFAFAYFGDIQIVDSAEADYAAWEALAMSALARNPDILFALQGGDIVESGIDKAQWEAFLRAADAALGDVPFFPAVGNHESNFLGGKPRLFLDMFELPGNGPEGFKEEFYSFDCGDVHVLVLNSWVFSGEQPLTEEDFDRIDGWIAADLAMTAATWKVAVTHIPVYPVHSDVTSDKMRARWAPIFDKYGLDLCFVGHQHVYSRLKPLLGGIPDYLGGVTYIMGNSGLKSYSSADETLAERTVYDTPTYQLVRVDGDRLTVQAFDRDGSELDYVELRPRGYTPTRAELVTALWLSAGSPKAAPHPFTDASPDDTALSWAYGTGLVVGYGDGRFGPGDVATREQIGIVAGRQAASADARPGYQSR